MEIERRTVTLQEAKKGKEEKRTDYTKVFTRTRAHGYDTNRENNYKELYS